MHCFSSSRALAEAALSLGFYLSMSASLPFQIRRIARDLCRRAPGQDSGGNRQPLSGPPPHRGKRCEPAFTAHTAAKVRKPWASVTRFLRGDLGQFRSIVHQGRMTDILRITILGCASSGGVPRIGPKGPIWGDCDPENPKNRDGCALLAQRIGPEAQPLCCWMPGPMCANN